MPNTAHPTTEPGTTGQDTTGQGTPGAESTDIALIGMAGRFPGARNLDAYWRNLRDGVESITFLDEEELLAHGVPREALRAPNYIRAASVLDGYDRFDAPFFGYNAREAAILDPQQRLFLESSWAALEDAGHTPGSFGGSIGVYAASNLSTYLMTNLIAGRGLPPGGDSLELVIANDKDYVANRVAYKLDLDGPAVCVQTACSSSLVAVHLAVQALLGYECDMALAGGVTLRFPQHAGYFHREGMIFSADGHCRPFDARATGTVAGNGVGVVVLKRLEDAIADGDHIEAVIKGSAVNNDGAAKIGYTAPSVDGQAQVVAAALGIAGVEPATITAIEAHGTGTPLGDPIEVRALTQVFGPTATGPGQCALGSVKGNIGHLDSTAGVAGLIKAVLQLRHGELVPSVNFEAPNPEIDFAATPFHVNTELRKWTANGHPRRIGVSSFGIGGTNAHVVLEEPPQAAPAPPPARAVQALTISARTPAALDEATANLAAALVGNGHHDLADVAHTLQTGRTGFPHRRVVVARDAADAAAALRELDPQRVTTHGPAGEARTVLLFPGQGSQYPGMGRDLYENEPVFRAQVDACAEELAPHLGFDLRDALFPAADADPQEAARRLEQTATAQPALFTVEYALAALLESWGVAPDAMIGHSIGEITAACRAGVLTLPGALRMVAVRGRLMQSLPTGAMLSAALPEERLRAILPDGLSVAAVNGPELCVVSGPHDAVAAFRQRLEGDGVAARPLHTSHAFHSAMMEPITGAFAAELAGIELRPPRIPFVSNRTGTWITPEQATDPGYWVGHIRDAVRFGDGVDLVTQDGPAALVEVGPGHTLGTLARSGSRGRGCTVLATLPGPREDADEQEFLTGALGRMWLAGARVDWAALHGERRRRVSLPTYPFEPRRYWIEPKTEPKTGPEAESGGGTGGLDLDVQAPAEPETRDDFAVGALDPRPVLSTDFLAPRDPREERIAAIWQEMLGVGPIGVHDSFVELGGHSLLAARVLERVNADLGSAVSPRQLFNAPTVAGLAQAVAETGGAAAEAGAGPESATRLPQAVPEPDRLHEPFPLTEIQQAQWIGRLGTFNVGDVAAHVYWEVELDDAVDLGRLEHTWNRLMDRHAMLRAVIHPDGRQQILPDVGPYRFPVLDLRTTSEDERTRQLEELRDRLSHEVRPTDTWPLFDVRTTLLPGGRTRLHVSFDLLIADIGSIRILMRDWRKLYQHGEDALPPLTLSYRDYALASAAVRDTPLHQRALAYWRDRVRDLPPGPDLPLAMAPAALTSPEFAARRAVIPRAVWERFTDRAAKLGVTPSVALLAVYARVLGTWCRGGRFTLNVTVTNRLEVHDEVPDLVGEFASFDLLPVDLTAGDGIAALAARMQEQAWQDLEHRCLNGVEVLREMARQRGGTSGAVMPVVFTSTLVQQNEPGDESMFGWLGEMSHEIAQTPQVWMDAGVLEVADGIQLSWHGVRQLFPDGVLDDMFDRFQHLVDVLAETDEAWTGAPASLLPDHQRELIAAVNDTAGPVPDGFLFTPLVEQARRTPERVAIIAPGGALTFGDLYRHACHVARRLRELGAGPGQLVAVAADKSREQIVAALGVLLAGGAYLPIDPDLPTERQDHLLDHGRARIVVTRAGGPDRTWPDGLRQVVVDLATAVGDDGPPEPVQQPGDLAYVVYTSGSTGQPKGVMLSHRAALNTLADINERFRLGPDDRVLGLSSLSFDLSVWDVFGVLGAGGALVLPETDARRDPGRWLELVTEHRVTVWNSVPALMAMFAEHVAGLPARPELPLRLALLSGDWIPVDLPGRLRGIRPGMEVISLGGATEAAVWSIYYPIGEVDPSWDSIPYGRPLRNQSFHVFNDRMEECPVWTTGELYIGGAGVAEGYWRDEERTAASFVTHPVTGERLYRTGDLGRRLPDGDIEFLGREDFQVKIGGFRIELGEIESVLLGCAGVRTAVAAAVGPDRHHRRLAAYLVPDDDNTDRDALVAAARQAAESTLPAYMVPSTFTVLDRLPLTANGKVDRSALPEPGATAAAVDSGPASPLALRLAGLVAEVLGLESVAPQQNFFEIGGDSIKGIQIISRANAEGLEVTPADLFQQQTISALAAVLEERGAGTAAAPGAGGPVPLTPHQRRLIDRAAPALPAATHRVELPVDAALEPQTAGQALESVVERHAALRLRLAEQGAEWAQYAAEADPDACYVPLIDLAALPAERREAAMRQMVAEMAGELDLLHGPVTKAALFDLGDGPRRLVWLAHALAVDAPSWQPLLDDLRAALAPGQEPAPRPAAAPAFPRWAEQLATRTGEAPPAGAAPQDGAELPLGTATAAEPFHVTGALSAEETAALLDGARAAYRMSPQEVCLAATALALGAVTGGGHATVEVEYDLRGDGAAGTVGACTGTAPVTVPLGTDGDLAALLAEVKERHRDAAAHAPHAVPGERPQLLLGAVCETGEETVPLRDEAGAPPRPLVVTPCLAAGRLHLGLTSHADAEETACRLAQALREGLHRLAAHCQDPDAGRVTPSDFPLAGLDEDELSTFLAALTGDAADGTPGEAGTTGEEGAR
jgi:amino acid adenylation domain-containing protein